MRKVGQLPDPESGGVPVGSMPEPEGIGAPFLKPEQIGKSAVIRILGNLRTSSSEFSDYHIDVEFHKKTYTLGLKLKSGNYNQLFQAFGKNPKKWRGKNVRVAPAVHMKKKYVQIQEVL